MQNNDNDTWLITESAVLLLLHRWQQQLKSDNILYILLPLEDTKHMAVKVTETPVHRHRMSSTVSEA